MKRIFLLSKKNLLNLKQTPIKQTDAGRCIRENGEKKNRASNVLLAARIGIAF